MLEAIDWSVVVVGRWNPSILTPAGIMRRLFKEDETTPIAIELAIDVMLPPKVTHNDLRVTVGSQKLVIEPLTHSYTCLDRARELARNALTSLPETPVTATGVNITYVYKEADSYLSRVQEIAACELDQRISSRNQTISKRSVARSMPVLDSQLNLSISEDGGDGIRVHFNFEYRSPDEEQQCNWLTRAIDDFKKEVRANLIETLEFGEELIPND